MPGLVSKSVIEELRARNDIVEVIGSHIELKRAGGTFKALCPFHREKTPSFNVHPHRQIYHCFGCDKGGDVISFVQEYEGVDFPTAIRLLAERSGMRLEVEDSPRDEGGGFGKDVLYKVLEEAAALYRRVLDEHESAAVARAYLERRRIERGSVEAFRLGFAPDIRGGLTKWGERHKVSPALLEAAGLLAQGDPERGGGWYERFRGRLMFPIHDELGRVIGFSGRILDDEARTAKYVNSPETPVFHKSRVFYALDKARQAIARERTAILCEGQIDAIRCHEAGIDHTVATQGTALTEAHARLIKRYADSVVLVLDADAAGQDAAIRSADAFLGAGLTVRIAALPPGEDPDSLILGQGRDALLALIRDARGVVDFQIGVLETREDVASEEGRARIIRSVLETISRVPEAVQQEQLLKKVAQRFYVTEHLLRDDLRKFYRRWAQASTPEESRAGADHPAAEVSLLEVMSQHEETGDLVRRFLPLDRWTDADCRRIAEAILEGDAPGGQPGAGLAGALSDTSPECQRLAAAVQMAPSRLEGEESDPIVAAQDIILVIHRKALERRRGELRRRARETEGIEQDRLDTEIKQITLDLNRFRQGWAQALPILELE